MQNQCPPMSGLLPFALFCALIALTFAHPANAERKEGKRIYRHVLTAVGEQPFSAQASRNAGDTAVALAKTNEGEVIIELIPSEKRTVTAGEVSRLWRDRVPAIPDAVELSFSSDLLGGADEIDIQLAGRDFEQLQRVAALTKAKLREKPGVIDVSDSFRGGRSEIRLDVTPRAESLGISLHDLARQVRQGFYGEEVQRIQRTRDEVRVMLRYPEANRTSYGDLRNMRIRTPNGGEIPFVTSAVASTGRGFSAIRRVDRRRTISVTANVDDARGNANEVVADLEANFWPTMAADFPGVSYSFEGEQRSQREAIESLGGGLLAALFAIYLLLAIPFRSYWQPLIGMSVVPFGFIGAAWGHILLGLSMSVFSLCGVVALSGVVVNDSLVLVSFVNRERKRRRFVRQAATEASVARFRPVLLISLTTAAGLMPLILEREVQAQFLIPMAVSLAAGVLFATAITLALVPSIYLILDDLGRIFFPKQSATGDADEAGQIEDLEPQPTGD